MEFERVFYKNNYAAGVAIMNIYMVNHLAVHWNPNSNLENRFMAVPIGEIWDIQAVIQATITEV
jgi:hypothetical protein